MLLSSVFNIEPSYSVILGVLCIIGFFLLSAITVLGVKATLIFIRKKFAVEKPPVKQPVKPRAKPIKSIEINPEEVDRISFKKSG